MHNTRSEQQEVLERVAGATSPRATIGRHKRICLLDSVDSSRRAAAESSFELHHVFWHSRSRGASSTLVDSSRRAADAYRCTVGMQACMVLVDTRIIEVCYDAMSSCRYPAATVVPPCIHKNAQTRTACAFRASCSR